MNDIFAPNRRMIILQVLKGDNDYSMNNGILQKVLVQFGHGVGLDKTNQEIAWLKEKDLVSVEKLNEELSIVKLTRKGLDVADGHDQIEGIERPGPE